MFFSPRIESVPFSQYRSLKDLSEREKKLVGSLLAAGAGVVILKPEAAGAAGIAERIANAFDPVIELMQGISYPVAFIMITGGFLLITLGQRHKGLAMMKWAGVGFLGMQLAPAIMDILVEVGNAMRK